MSAAAAGPMLRAMVGVGLAAGLLIVGVYEGTRERIASNRAAALERAIFEVLPEASSSAPFRLAADERFEAGAGAPGDRRVYAGYDDARRLVGLAVEADGMGYQDTIRVIYGYSFERHAIVGFRVLESRETPGLGDRIEHDAAFLDNFRALDVTLDAAGQGLAHPIEAVKHGAKQHPWQVDGITGATISSGAVAALLSKSAAFWVPRIERARGDFAAAQEVAP